MDVNPLNPMHVVIMVSVVTSQRDALLSPTGTNVWSGQIIQSLNSDAVTWSLAKELYGSSGPYFIVPLSLLIGAALPAIQWCISKVRDLVTWCKCYKLKCCRDGQGLGQSRLIM